MWNVGTSGGVWGSERGYCLMIGGEDAIVRKLDPVFIALAPSIEEAAAHTRSRGTYGAPPNTATYTAVPAGAGHFRQDGP